MDKIENSRQILLLFSLWGRLERFNRSIGAHLAKGPKPRRKNGKPRRIELGRPQNHEPLLATRAVAGRKFRKLDANQNAGWPPLASESWRTIHRGFLRALPAGVRRAPLLS